jgi:hypothetical protein
MGGGLASFSDGGALTQMDSASGGSMSMSAVIGYTLSPNYLLHLEAKGDILRGAYTDSFGDDVHLSAFAGGPGLTYYFQGPSVYVGGTALLGQVTNSDAGTSDMGIGASVLGGWDWWVFNGTLTLGIGAEISALRVDGINVVNAAAHLSIGATFKPPWATED